MMLRTACLVALLSPWLAADERVIPGYEGQTKKTVDRALEQYRLAKSYSDRLVLKATVEVESLQPVRVPDEPFEGTLAWMRPNRIALDMAGYAVFCDGTSLWQYFKQVEQYTVSPAPARLDLAGLQLKALGLYEQMSHPIAMVLGRENATPRDLLGPVTRFEGIQVESRDGRPGQRIRGVMEQEVAPGSNTDVPFSVWFNDRTGLIEEIHYDHTRHVQAIMTTAAPGVIIKKYFRDFRFHQIALDDEKTAQASFAFKTGVFDDQVAQLRPLRPEEWQARLLGRPAPPFNGKDLEGKSVAFSDLKGRVVLLDFWASFCGPCIMAMPSLQRLADKFADKPVSILGVNGDPPDRLSTVKGILERQKVRYRQIVDSQSSIFAAYRVQPIPCVVLIGKEGHIQAIHNGFSYGEEQELTDEIEKLLASKNLVPLRVPPASQPASGPVGN